MSKRETRRTRKKAGEHEYRSVDSRPHKCACGQGFPSLAGKGSLTEHVKEDASGIRCYPAADIITVLRSVRPLKNVPKKPANQLSLAAKESLKRSALARSDMAELINKRLRKLAEKNQSPQHSEPQQLPKTLSTDTSHSTTFKGDDEDDVDESSVISPSSRIAGFLNHSRNPSRKAKTAPLSVVITTEDTSFLSNEDVDTPNVVNESLVSPVDNDSLVTDKPLVPTGEDQEPVESDYLGILPPHFSSTSPVDINWGSPVPPQPKSPPPFPSDSQLTHIMVAVPGSGTWPVLSTADKALLELGQIVMDNSLNLHQFSDVLLWLRRTASKGLISINEDLGTSSLRRFLDTVGSQVPVPQPKFIPVALENRETTAVMQGSSEEFDTFHRDVRFVTKVATFDFAEQLRLFFGRDDLFGNLDNLCVNIPPELDVQADISQGHASPTAGRLFLPYEVQPDEELDDLHSAAAYQDAIAYLRQEGVDFNREFVVPILTYVDKTNKGAMGRFGMEPKSAVVTILKRHLRNKANSWFILGYIPDLDVLLSKAEKARNNRGAKNLGMSNRNYQRCVMACISSLVDCMEIGIPGFSIRLGPYVKMFHRVRVVQLAVLGDGKNADCWGGRHAPHNSSIKRHMVGCSCPFHELDNPEYICQPIYSSEMELLVKRAFCCKSEDWGATIPTEDGLPSEEIELSRLPLPPLGSSLSEVRKHYWDHVRLMEPVEANRMLRQLSQHRSICASFDLNFGGDPRGIYGCLPLDLMHAFLLGVLRQCLHCIFDQVGGDSLARVDEHMVLVRQQRQSRTKEFPRISFTKLTDLTRITAREWAGIAFSLMCILSTKAGQAAFVFTTGTTTHSRTMRIVALLEDLLGFYAYYQVGDMWKVGDTATPARLKERIKETMERILNTVPRTEGHGWKISKFHGLLHIPETMIKYGRPGNYDAGVGEKNLKTQAMLPARTAQMRGQATFLEQVCDRVRDKVLIETALRDPIPGQRQQQISTGNVAKAKVNPTVVNVTPLFCSVTSPDLISDYCVEWNSRVGDSLVTLDRVISDRLFGTIAQVIRRLHAADKNCFPEGPFLKFWCYSEMHVPEKQVLDLDGGLKLRCHPNYQGCGRWYDWVMLFREEMEDNSYILAKLISIIKVQSNSAGTNFAWLALVHACEPRVFELMPSLGDTKLVRKHRLKYRLGPDQMWYYPSITTATLDEIKGSFLVIEEHPVLGPFPDKIGLNAYKDGWADVNRITSYLAEWPDTYFQV